MCGICGIVSLKGEKPSKAMLTRMMDLIRHRGPDDDGIFMDDPIALGFVRLSIIDISQNGHQPFTDESGRYVIIYNGEVYNYIELREDLRRRGYEFHSASDTEVVLNSYIEWGTGCLDKFNGMWSFAIYDKTEDLLFLARDRYGVKPLYYYKGSDFLIFSSEIPPLLAALKEKPVANRLQVYDYLVFNRTDNTEDTFFDNILRLPHGSIMTIKSIRNRPEILVKKWYELRERVKTAESFKSQDEYFETLKSSVGLRLRSDVPVGICLSGGLDSSSILSILLKEFNRSEINTFSAVYNPGDHGDETPYINEYSSALKNIRKTTPTASSLYNDLVPFIEAHAEPMPSTSPYAQFKVMEMAKKHVVVTLDGQGADEQLAGYYYFFGLYFKELFKKQKYSELILEIICYINKHKSFYGLKTFLFFMMPESNRSALRIRNRNYISGTLIHEKKAESKVSETLYGASTLNEALLDHFDYKLEHLLKWEDRNSMYHSIEARVPFLDYRLVERTLASDAQIKIYNGTSKYILRESMKGILPEKIRTRADKTGFSTPQSEWFKSEKFKVLANDILSSGNLEKRGLIDTGKAKSLLKNHISGRIDVSNEIWKWINLEYWYRSFID